MKKLILILAVVVLTGCANDRPPHIEDPHHCYRPDDIPETLVTGETIYWDCVWQEAYNDGRVQVVHDSNGDVIAVAKLK